MRIPDLCYFSTFSTSTKHTSVKNNTLTSPPLPLILFYGHISEGKTHTHPIRWAPTSYKWSYNPYISAFINLELGFRKEVISSHFYLLKGPILGTVNLPLKFIPGWWSNHPFEKCARQIGSFPQFLGWKFKKSFKTEILQNFQQHLLLVWSLQKKGNHKKSVTVFSFTPINGVMYKPTYHYSQHASQLQPFFLPTSCRVTLPDSRLPTSAVAPANSRRHAKALRNATAPVWGDLTGEDPGS